ncbi:MAG: hypothetical protein GX786_08325, partial [Clostridiales bacterium]|nr:hypothetical protein [Clostridiales bacterium]
EFPKLLELLTPLLSGGATFNSTLLLIFFSALLILLLFVYGFLRNNLFPFVFAAAPKGPVKTYQATSSLLKRNRGKQLLLGLVRFLFRLPLYAGFLLLGYSYFCETSPQMIKGASFLLHSVVTVPFIPYSTTPWVLPVVLGCFAFTILFIGFTNLLSAAFAVQLSRE